MAGNVREKRPGVWEVRVFLGRDGDGKVRHLSRTVRGTKREAQRELKRLSADIERQRSITEDTIDREQVNLSFGTWDETTTVNDAINGWRSNGWEDLSPSTTRRYQSLWRVHIRDSIGLRRIVDLGPYEVEQFLRQLKRDGLGEASVHQARAVLHRACRLARKWSNNHLPNPITDTEMPDWSLDEQPQAVRAPSVQEVRALLQAARNVDQRIGAYVRVVAATGARRAEVAALRWSDVDWEGGVLTIDESLVVVKGGVKVKRPKTRKSIRVIAVDGATMDELRAFRAERAVIADRFEVALDPDGFVFSTEPDAAVAPYLDNFTRVFSDVRVAAGVADDVHLHSLRHFQSTELDPVISEAQKQTRLGWSTVQMARHYTDGVPAKDGAPRSHWRRSSVTRGPQDHCDPPVIGSHSQNSRPRGGWLTLPIRRRWGAARRRSRARWRVLRCGVGCRS